MENRIKRIWVLTHNKTGKMFLGCSIYDNYYGQGDDWMAHLDEHGWDYTRQCLFEDYDHDLVHQKISELSVVLDVEKSETYLNKVENIGPMSLSHTWDFVMPEKAKRAISKHFKGRPNPKNGKPVMTPQGQFESAAEASRHYGIKTCTGEARAKYGRKGWSYVDQIG